MARDVADPEPWLEAAAFVKNDALEGQSLGADLQGSILLRVSSHCIATLIIHVICASNNIILLRKYLLAVKVIVVGILAASSENGC